LATASQWVAGARPRTLVTAVVPVAVGVAAAHTAARIVPWRAVLALIVALAIQIGTNYANDYSDGIRGTDEVRVGPTRLVAGGLATPAAVRAAAFASFGLAGVCGLVLAIATSPWIILVGAAAIAAGWFYTGGPRPYGYAGFGELFVFVFFGIVAVAGTAYVSVGRLVPLSFVAAIPVGIAATALLVVNNLRDIPTDAKAGKQTIAVRLGDARTRWLYASCLLAATLSTALSAFWRPWAAIALVAGVFAVRPIRVVTGGASGRDLIPVLGMTALFQLVLGGLLTIGLLV
jgi:1,4-dihydroxy-2-naphthoate octaprenyltransferase